MKGGSHSALTRKQRPTKLKILAEKAFEGNCLNRKYALNITKNKKTKKHKKHLFQFDGNFYGQVDKVAMSSPLGPLMANAFMCHIEEKLENQNKMSA